MATLEPSRSTSRGSASRKGKERAILSSAPGSSDGQQQQQGYDQDQDQERGAGGYGYEAQYQEPEYLTVEPSSHSRGTRRPVSSGDNYDRHQHHHRNERHERGTYDSRGTDDPELGQIDGGGGAGGSAGIGNQQGLGVSELGAAAVGSAGGAYPPVSEEEAEERRIQEHLSKIAARDMAHRKAARASKLYVNHPHPLPSNTNANNYQNNGISTALSAAPAVVATTLAAGLSRASTLLRNRTRRGQSGSTSSTSTGGRSYGGVGGSDHLGSEGGGAGAGKQQGRPGSMFGFWRIPSIDDTLAEEREDARRQGGWAREVGEGDADVELPYKPARSPLTPIPTISRPSSANPYDEHLTATTAAAAARTGYGQQQRIPSSSSISSVTDTLVPLDPNRGGRNSPSPTPRTTQPGIENDPIPSTRSTSDHYYQQQQQQRESPTRATAASGVAMSYAEEITEAAGEEVRHRHSGARRSETQQQQQQQTQQPYMPTATASGSGSGWKGEHWRGGAGYSDVYPGNGGGVSGQAVAGGQPVRQERWWHALCAWGNELDDGAEDGQAGRTNPFE
ncbi:hypothetical protein QFC21_006252 [Naganishia friedmannii]|uniref:Uncharacterized protein n=1 Tax=Naganishia friedmannii TaxID=89922 RepID=A0ACC2V3F5_9TREE|nr:hypothetical protein QFC21_006252 [Naganishia friedmannii]